MEGSTFGQGAAMPEGVWNVSEQWLACLSACLQAWRQGQSGDRRGTEGEGHDTSDVVAFCLIFVHVCWLVLESNL